MDVAAAIIIIRRFRRFFYYALRRSDRRGPESCNGVAAIREFESLN